MGGSGGGRPYYSVSPEVLQKRVKDASESLAREFIPRLQELLDERLSTYNRRDVEKIQERLGAIKKQLGQELDGTWDLRFGGSVAKHTYVDGISDVDSLLILGSSAADTPDAVLAAVAKQLSGLPNVQGVSVGQIAITVSYRDGMDIQLVPAVRKEGALQVPSWTRDGWSRIDPQKFTKALTRRNEQCDGKLIPTIKLAKAAIANWPEPVRLSGYHVESLAIDAFRNYDGPKITASMLPHLFERASNAVLKPIKDRTGQSIHVDAYLGKSNSEVRQKAGHWCEQVAKRMRNATLQSSTTQWDELFDE